MHACPRVSWWTGLDEEEISHHTRSEWRSWSCKRDVTRQIKWVINEVIVAIFTWTTFYHLLPEPRLRLRGGKWFFFLLADLFKRFFPLFVFFSLIIILLLNCLSPELIHGNFLLAVAGNNLFTVNVRQTQGGDGVTERSAFFLSVQVIA